MVRYPTEYPHEQSKQLKLALHHGSPEESSRCRLGDINAPDELTRSRGGRQCVTEDVGSLFIPQTPHVKDLRFSGCQNTTPHDIRLLRR